MAFNGGSQLAISNPGDGAAISKAIVNTILGGSVGGMVAMGCYRMNFDVKCGPQGKPAFWSCLMTINGGLAGKNIIYRSNSVTRLFATRLFAIRLFETRLFATLQNISVFSTMQIMAIVC